MAFKITPLRSKPIYLADISKDFQLEEGEDCPEQERTWVVARQATEGDVIEIADLGAERITQWAPDGLREIRTVNERRTWMKQVYLCLVDAGNLLAEDGADLIEFKDGHVSMGWQNFTEVWRELPDFVAVAILSAVYMVNPQWNWMWLESQQGEAMEVALGKKSPDTLTLPTWTS